MVVKKILKTINSFKQIIKDILIINRNLDSEIRKSDVTYEYYWNFDEYRNI